MKNCVIIMRWWIYDDSPSIICVYEVDEKETQESFLEKHPTYKGYILEFATLEK